MCMKALTECLPLFLHVTISLHRMIDYNIQAVAKSFSKQRSFFFLCTLLLNIKQGKLISTGVKENIDDASTSCACLLHAHGDLWACEPYKK